MSDWLNSAVFYEIYPQSFQDTNADGIGDIPGIMKRLDYIKNLGCNAIWLNPCFESPFSDAGYDVSDYCKVAPRYGTMEEIEQLFEEVHARKMHIILDLVPGHTSLEHKWFKESMKAEKNEFSGRYIWSDDIMDDMSGVGNITGCIRGISDRYGSCAVNFFSTQPALNYGFARCDKPWQQPVDSEDAVKSRQAIKEIMRFWLRKGCDGFRVDMAGSMVKNDEDKQATIALWREFRTFLDQEFPQAVMISEWGDPDKSLQAGFHMDFLLHFGPSHYNDLFRGNTPFFAKEGKGDISQFASYYKNCYETTKGKGLICIPSGNHDMVRLAKTLSPEEMKLAFAFVLSMPGAPFIYYGDEIGMRYVENLTSVEGGYYRTGSRSPMQWDHREQNAGFSDASEENLYIRMDPEAIRPTVSQQMEQEDSLWKEVHQLLAIRGQEEALLANGGLEFLYAEQNSYPLVYKRFAPGSSILVIINPSERATECQIEVAETERILYCYGEPASFDRGIVRAPACSVTFIKLK